MSEIEIRLVIIEPLIESSVLELLAHSAISCSGRYLDLADINQNLHEQTLLITTPSSLRELKNKGDRGKFFAIVSIGEKSFANIFTLPERELAKLPEVINELIAKASDRYKDTSEPEPLIRGVVPRVGVSALTEIIERKIGGFFLTMNKRQAIERREVFLAEIDDHSILRLCQALNERGVENRECGVVINKVPDTPAARRRLRALEGEMRGAGVSFFHPIYFDLEIQVTGVASNKTIRAAQPLFDWIAKAN